MSNVQMYDVYLAGAMTGRPVGEVLKERSLAHDVLRAVGLTWYDPATDEDLDKLDPESIITTAFNPEKMVHYVKKDLNAVANSRSILNLTGDRISDGSCWEMAFGVYHRHIPVHIVAPARKAAIIVGFTSVLVDGLHDNLEEAIEAIKKELR